MVGRSTTDRGELYQLTHAAATIDTRAYDNGGRMTSSTYNNGVSETRSYIADNTLASIAFSGAAIGNLSYSWDDNKNKTAESISGTMSGYGFSVGTGGYDSEDRLVNYNRTDTNLDQTWNLSAVGDWNSVTTEGAIQSRTHGPAHELLTAAGQSVSTDVTGNITLIPAALRPNSQSLAMNWDFDNRLSTADVSNNASVDVTYKFDALGRRVYRQSSTETMVYVQSGQQTIADYVAGAAAVSPTYRYVYASYIDEPVLRYKPVGAESLYYHRNQQYSIVALTNGTGSIVERYAYSAYGVPTITDASGGGLAASAYGNRYTYTGREWDSSLFIYHYRARMYDPNLGRFCSRVPSYLQNAFDKVKLSNYAYGGALTGGYALSTADPGNCAWWLAQYLRGIREVDLNTVGLFDEWRANVASSIDGEISNALSGFSPGLSCNGKSGLVKGTPQSSSGSISTQVTGVPLCSRIGPIGGSLVSYTANCTSTANCDKCPACYDVFSQEPNAIFGIKTCEFSFFLEDQFSNPGDFGGAKNKPKDLNGFHDCVDDCNRLRLGPLLVQSCIEGCRQTHLVGDLVPVVTDPYPGTFPYWIRARWTESKSSYFKVDCGSRPSSEPGDEEDENPIFGDPFNNG